MDHRSIRSPAVAGLAWLLVGAAAAGCTPRDPARATPPLAAPAAAPPPDEALFLSGLAALTGTEADDAPSDWAELVARYPSSPWSARAKVLGARLRQADERAAASARAAARARDRCREQLGTATDESAVLRERIQTLEERVQRLDALLGEVEQRDR